MSNFKEKTKVQHYLSQVEQRLNAIDPTKSIQTQRIHSFSIVNRENYELSLDDSNGVQIYHNLQSRDLYSFDELDQEQRYSLEKLFGKYERDIISRSNKLIEKVSNNDSNILHELVELFRVKILNSIRNPYCIEKTIETFKQLESFSLVEEDARQAFQRIRVGCDPTRPTKAKEFEVSEEMYLHWLEILLKLLSTEEQSGKNFLDHLVDSLFKNPNIDVLIIIRAYNKPHSDKYVTLSDRGFVLFENNEAELIYQFNLKYNTLISFCFTDLRKLLLYSSEDSDLVDEILKSYINHQKNIKIDYCEKNDLEALKLYNQRVIDYSHSKSFLQR
jgi:hypothetical protein